MIARAACAVVCGILCALSALGAEPWKPIAHTLPPPGEAIENVERDKLNERVRLLAARIDKLTQSTDAKVAALAVDIDIFCKAVAMAVEHGEFYRAEDVSIAHKLLDAADQRAESLAGGQHPWTAEVALVVRGYRSRIDDSAQPYGLVIPKGLDPQRRVPLYVWLHGRNDKLTDLYFLQERMTKPGQLQRDDAIVLHPFGRSCLGWKSAAEIDVLEAIASVQERYPIDPDRVVLMGFSMGGAGAWHLGAHYADHFAAVHAGAGFVDVAQYQHLAPSDYPPPYEQKLWGVYDVPDYVRNLFNVPVVAYSGEQDKQKQAADQMAEAFAAYGQKLVHLIGPGMGHKYADASWREVVARMAAAAGAGRPRDPARVSLQTRTLRYGRMYWVEALGLDEHWREARIDAEFTGPDELTVRTQNVRRLRLMPARRVARLTIDGTQLAAPERQEFVKQGTSWAAADPASKAQLEKTPGLQGPIDDAFLEPFLVVRPTGPSSPELQQWVDFELAHFLARWQHVYRGTPRIKRDVDVTDDDLTRYHVVAWGDPQSNDVIRRAAPRLPVSWSDSKLQIGQREFDRAKHVPVLIYPNPLAPQHYLVLNSGPTHREAHDRTNSLQNPKLPDWAVVDLTSAPSDRSPGDVVAADFFDENWQVRPQPPADR